MWLKLALVVVVAGLYTGCDGQAPGYRLQRDASYFITAPKKIVPNQVVQMSVSILQMYYKNVNVRTSIRRGKEELAFAETTFYQQGMQMMQMRVPQNADTSGNYTLRIEGTSNGGISGFIFENETDLIFDTKQVSLFIQPNKPLYRQTQTVRFRIMPVEPNLMSRSGSMDVYVEDATGHIVRRWLAQQTNAGGVLDMEFTISDQPHYGEWKIRVYAFGHWYEEPIRVDEFWITAIDVNVSMPLYILDDDFGLGGVMMANFSKGYNKNGLSLGQAGKGTVKVKCDINKAPGDLAEGEDPLVATVEHETRYFPGVGDFLFTMQELKDASGLETLAGYELHVVSEVYDWFLYQSATGAATAVVYKDDARLQLLGDPARTFKPNQTTDIYYAVVHRDGMPLHRQRRQVTLQMVERTITGNTLTYDTKFLVRDDGIAHYRFRPRNDAQFITITAYYDVYQTQTEYVSLYRHFSPTDSYIYVTTSTEKPQVDEYMVFTVTANTYVEYISYLVTAAGNIITGNTLEMGTRQKTFSLALSRDMIPHAHLVVWHVFQGEVVADCLNFFVNGTRINPVDAQFNRGKDFTGDTVEINAWTDPSSFLGVSAIDYELWRYGWGTFITETRMIQELSSYDSHANQSFSMLWKLPEEQTHIQHFPSPTYGVDANTTFDYAGLIVFTDANVTKVGLECNATLGYHPCMDGTCYFEDQRCDGSRQCPDGQDEMGCNYPEIDPHTSPRDRLGLVTRHYVMEGEFLWGGHFVMPNGRIDAIVEVPDEPMEWVMAAFAISRDLGFGVMHEPARHHATRPFYMRIEAPPEPIVKGEQVGIHIGLFNYFVEDLEVIVMLHDSEDYRFIIVEEFGIVSSYAPRTIRGDIQTMVFVEKGTVVQIHMPVLIVNDGCVTVRITANAFIYGDNEEVEICNKYDGVTNYLHTPYFIDLINSGSLVLPDLEIPVPERFIKPEERQHLYVPGSPEAIVGFVGDVVGPGFFEEFLTAENTLRKPFGGAEMSMYNIAYTFYNLQYLKETNQLRNEVLMTAIDHLNIAIQRQLSFMNEDGSFSQFRDYQEHTPSTWASAFILQVFNNAQERDWELDFFIPTELLNKIMNWLCTRQNADGSFYDDAPMYDRKMRSNMTNIDGNMKLSNFSLTAFVLISLSQSNRVTSDASVCRAEAMNGAKSYLERHFTTLPDEEIDVFETCICTYALHLVSSDKITEAFAKMQAMQRQGPGAYWADKDVPPNDIKTIDTIPYYQPRRWYDNEGYAVAATSYALLTYMRRNMLLDSEPIMKWLQTMRNTFAGQASTQDSIIALQALVEYAKRDTNRAFYNVQVTLEATSMGNYSERVRMQPSNWPDLQTTSVVPVWGSVRGRAQGTGIALMQLSTSVNVEYPHQIMPVAEGKFFDVEITDFNFTGFNYSIMELRACSRWARADLSERSGLTVLEIHIPTGYVITNDVLRGYAQSGDVPTLRHAEAFDRRIFFFFDYLEHQQATCIQFRMDRWFPVANMTIQHLLKVYDYYEPGMHNTTLYNTWQLFNLHICQVCGSFQCPYCRFYNSAQAVQSSIVVMVAAFVVYMFVDETFRDRFRWR